ncbi:hypothetical protein X777_01263 [Ooceraea biroi]|uniref:Uncharacterized protein n=1 Tax=Ooceraea biroi TaxID=2015173 RepID=A0A026WRI8_OOCBI|nr:hypothetical protein X777_01263 [Ooceraea biroi]
MWGTASREEERNDDGRLDRRQLDGESERFNRSPIFDPELKLRSKTIGADDEEIHASERIGHDAAACIQLTSGCADACTRASTRHVDRSNCTHFVGR